MAERSALRLPRLLASFDLGLNHLATEVVSLPRRVPRQRPRGPALHRLLWRLVWLPYWLGSDVPAPQLPARDQVPPAEIGLAGEQVLRMLDGLARRIWLLRVLTILARASWLGLLVGCVWLLLERQGGPAFDGDLLLPFTVVILLVSLVFAALMRPTRRQVARMLDRSFGLHERMITAVDHLGRAVPAEGERASVVYLQMADAANVVTDLRGHPAFAIRPPLREIVSGIACALLLAALFFLRGVGGGIPPVAAGTVPAFVPAADRVAEEAAAAQAQAQAALSDAPTAAEVQARAERSNALRQDLQRLSEALDDHAVTRSAADAVQRGDYGAAADDLRRVANDVDQLSAGARQGLADDLDQAANQMAEGQDGLAEASRSAADGLREGDQAAQEGVRELGEAVDRAGENVVSQQELAEQMRQAEAADENATQGQQGESAAGDPGEQGQPGNGQSEGEAGAEEASGQTGSEGEGAQSGAEGEAAPPGSGQPGDGQEPGQQPGQGEGQRGEGGAESERAGQGAEGAGAEAGGEAQPDGQTGQADGGEAAQGGGAGSGEQQTNQGETQAGARDDRPGAEGPPSEEQVTERQGEGSRTGETALPPAGEAVQLPRSSGQGVQTSNNAGSSSLGSGTGVAAASGTTAQGEVGAAGPDSNRVPPTYRSVVEDYFSDPSEQP